MNVGVISFSFLPSACRHTPPVPAGGPSSNPMKLKPRKDQNHATVVSFLRAAGCSVFDTAALGHGFPDLVVGWQGKNFLLEIKNGQAPPSRRKLTVDELLFSQNWLGQVAVVTSAEHALAVVRGEATHERQNS